MLFSFSKHQFKEIQHYFNVNDMKGDDHLKMAGYDYLTETKAATNIVGEFVDHRNDEFKQCLENLTEGFKKKWGFNIWDKRNFVEAMGRPEMASYYKNLLIGDVLTENVKDEWFDGHGAKLEQLFENTVDSIIKESTIQELNPIVSYDK